MNGLPEHNQKSSSTRHGRSTIKSTKRVLDPIDRVSEVLFGLIMVLTFTGSLSVAEAGRDDVRAMLIGALGCNLAWGIIDAVLYLMGSLAEKGGPHDLWPCARRPIRKRPSASSQARCRRWSRRSLSRRNWKRCAGGCTSCPSRPNART